jgi:hypothetical protein
MKQNLIKLSLLLVVMLFGLFGPQTLQAQSYKLKLSYSQIPSNLSYWLLNTPALVPVAKDAYGFGTSSVSLTAVNLGTLVGSTERQRLAVDLFQLEIVGALGSGLLLSQCNNAKVILNIWANANEAVTSPHVGTIASTQVNISENNTRQLGTGIYGLQFQRVIVPVPKISFMPTNNVILGITVQTPFALCGEFYALSSNIAPANMVANFLLDADFGFVVMPPGIVPMWAFYGGVRAATDADYDTYKLDFQPAPMSQRATTGLVSTDAVELIQNR